MPTVSHVLVGISAVSVNPIDPLIRGGLVAMKLSMPFIVGSDFSGIVVAVSEGVT